MPIDPGAKGNITELSIPRPLVITSSDAAKKIFRAFQKETLRLSDLGQIPHRCGAEQQRLLRK